MSMIKTAKAIQNKEQSAGKKLRRLAALKNGRGKKGFTLIELLVAVTVLAVLFPMLYKIFLMSSTLNKKSNMQGRADSLAEKTMEEIKTVQYNDLGEWLRNNGWTVNLSNDPQGTSTKIYEAEKTLDDGLKTLRFDLSKYVDKSNNERYKAGVPKFPGTDSKDISLTDKQLLGNRQNELAVSEMISRLNVNTTLKNKIWNAADISLKEDVLATNPTHVFDPSRMTLTLDGSTLQSSDLKKKTTVTIEYNMAHTMIIAAYEVKFEYSLSECEYNYLYYDENGRFRTASGRYIFSSSETVEEVFATGTVEKEYYGTYPDIQTVYITYTPLNENDKITIIPPSANNVYLIFEENKITGNENYVLSVDSFENDLIFYTDAAGAKKILKNRRTGAFAYFSSNNDAMESPFSESVYQDEMRIWLYEAVVTAEIRDADDGKPVTAKFTSTMFG